jgi:hypothetical protein
MHLLRPSWYAEAVTLTQGDSTRRSMCWHTAACSCRWLAWSLCCQQYVLHQLLRLPCGVFIWYIHHPRRH